MATLFEISEVENLDTQRLFLHASRIFPQVGLNPSRDHALWLQGEPLPKYMQEYVRYWEGLNRTETHRSRRFV